MPLVGLWVWTPTLGPQPWAGRMRQRRGVQGLRLIWWLTVWLRVLGQQRLWQQPALVKPLPCAA